MCGKLNKDITGKKNGTNLVAYPIDISVSLLRSRAQILSIDHVSGSDDMLVRVYNYNTMDKVHSFEAHADYIRLYLRFAISFRISLSWSIPSKYFGITCQSFLYNVSFDVSALV